MMILYIIISGQGREKKTLLDLCCVHCCANPDIFVHHSVFLFHLYFFPPSQSVLQALISKCKRRGHWRITAPRWRSPRTLLRHPAPAPSPSSQPKLCHFGVTVHRRAWRTPDEQLPQHIPKPKLDNVCHSAFRNMQHIRHRVSVQHSGTRSGSEKSCRSGLNWKRLYVLDQVAKIKSENLIPYASFQTIRCLHFPLINRITTVRSIWKL